MLNHHLDAYPEWNFSWPNGRTLLHYACTGINPDAAKRLLARGLDVDALSKCNETPAFLACVYNQPETLEVLITAGAQITSMFDHDSDYLDMSLMSRQVECAKILISNGVRLRSDYRTYVDRIDKEILPVLRTFQRGVLRCRSTAIAMIRVKRVANLTHVDKYLLSYMALQIWTTRTDDEWQK